MTVQKLALFALLLATSNAFASQTLECRVYDWGRGGLEKDRGESAVAKIDVKPGYGGVMQDVLKDGNFGCQITYRLIGDSGLFGIRLFRKDMVVANSFDKAFSEDKKVDSYVQQNDLSKVNYAARDAGEGFAAGLCECKSVE